MKSCDSNRIISIAAHSGMLFFIFSVFAALSEASFVLIPAIAAICLIGAVMAELAHRGKLTKPTTINCLFYLIMIYVFQPWFSFNSIIFLLLLTLFLVTYFGWKETTMSYRGSMEFICATGHRYECDCYDVEPTVCPTCKAKWTWQHSIDHTNDIQYLDPLTDTMDSNDQAGTLMPDPSTVPAAVVSIDGEEDVWQRDHYGNPYAIRAMTRVQPAPGSAWTPYTK